MANAMPFIPRPKLSAVDHKIMILFSNIQHYVNVLFMSVCILNEK